MSWDDHQFTQWVPDADTLSSWNDIEILLIGKKSETTDFLKKIYREEKSYDSGKCKVKFDVGTLTFTETESLNNINVVDIVKHVAVVVLFDLANNESIETAKSMALDVQGLLNRSILEIKEKLNLVVLVGLNYEKSKKYYILDSEILKFKIFIHTSFQYNDDVIKYIVRKSYGLPNWRYRDTIRDSIFMKCKDPLALKIKEYYWTELRARLVADFPDKEGQYICIKSDKSYEFIDRRDDTYDSTPIEITEELKDYAFVDSFMKEHSLPPGIDYRTVFE